MLVRSSLWDYGRLAIQILKRYGKFKEKGAHFRLTCVVQKRFCLTLSLPILAKSKFRPNFRFFILWRFDKQILPCVSTGRELLFEWSHHRISSTDSKVRVILQNSFKYPGNERVKPIYSDNHISVRSRGVLFRPQSGPFSYLKVWIDHFSACGHAFLYPEKTAKISRRYPRFPRKMTSEKRALKFHTDDASLPRSG